MRTWLPIILLATLISPAVAARHPEASSFDKTATAALAAMKSKADTLNVGGVAIVAYFEGNTLQSWSSKMLVVGHYKDLPTDTQKGNNLLAIAYAKAAEMADTLKDSGTATRPPMTGEFGWQGGVTAQTPHGHWIIAFSGGKSEDDVAISRAGLAKAMGGVHGR